MIGRIRGLAQWLLRVSARDWTDRLAAGPALVLAPHPDDETIGCGATIVRKIQAGTPVTVVIVTDGRHSHRSDYISPEDLAAVRRDEMAEAARRLGGPEVIWLDVHDGAVADNVAKLTDRVADLVREKGATQLFSTCAWEGHPDHAAVGRIARAVAAKAGVEAFEYPVWLWGTWPLTSGNRLATALGFCRALFTGRMVAVRTGPIRSHKLHALAAHRTQLGYRPDRVPDGEPWVGLPKAVLDDAGRGVEVFLRPFGKDAR